MYNNDKRIVATLDAGGTNLNFAAVQGNRIIIDDIHREPHADELSKCINAIISGFEEVISRLEEKPVAISFAFPGPADYPNGIIGGMLLNFPSFRNGVALGSLLAKHFGMPVFINNDADLFVYGEALAGALPEINRKLETLGSPKRYRNLIGFTWGTGFGFGFTVNNNMHIGDNSCSEVYCLPHLRNRNIIVEDGVSARAIRRNYGELSANTNHGLEPFEIFNVAEGIREGNKQAAIQTFEEFGKVAGDVIANVLTLIDGIVVIGGGLTKAHKYIMPSLMATLREQIHTIDGLTFNRLQVDAYYLDDEQEFKSFAKGNLQKLQIFETNDFVNYDPQKRVGITISKLGANHAVSMGAYAFALNEIDKKR